MLDDDVQARLRLMETARGLEVKAYVASAPARPLRWRLEVQSRSPGGVSNVRQEGDTNGVSPQAVNGLTRVNAGSEGTATLIVYDGDREVATEKIALSPASSADQ